MEEKKKHHRDKQKSSRANTIISNIILVIAVATFLFAGYKLYSIYNEYHKGEEEYEAVEKDVVEEIDIEVETVDEEGEVVVKTREVLDIDFSKLQAINQDVVAWIDFDEPSRISYPVVQGEDNDQYLRTTVEGKKNSSGSIFMDAAQNRDFTDRNTFIYGHNMKNGSMFGQLRKYKTEEFCKENPYFYLYTPDGKESKYQIFAVCIVEDTSRTYIKTYLNDETFMDYIEYIRGISRYDVDVEVTAESQIISLSTCTNVTETQRLVIHGVKVEEVIVNADLAAAAENTEEALEDVVAGE